MRSTGLLCAMYSPPSSFVLSNRPPLPQLVWALHSVLYVFVRSGTLFASCMLGWVVYFCPRGACWSPYARSLSGHVQLRSLIGPAALRLRTFSVLLPFFGRLSSTTKLHRHHATYFLPSPTFLISPYILLTLTFATTVFFFNAFGRSIRTRQIACLRAPYPSLSPTNPSSLRSFFCLFPLLFHSGTAIPFYFARFRGHVVRLRGRVVRFLGRCTCAGVAPQLPEL